MTINTIKNKYKIGGVLIFVLANGGVAYSGAMGEAVQEPNNAWFGSVTPFAGSFNDNSLIKYADYYNIVDGTNVNMSSKLPKTNPRWGYQLSLGYRLDPADTHDIILSYLDFVNSGSSTASALNPDGTDNNFNNLLTLIGSPGFSGMNLYAGVGSAYLKYKYQMANLLAYSHSPNETLPNVQFTTFYGVKASYIQRNLTAQYSGQTSSFSAITTTDYINTKATLYGFGPEIGMGSKWMLNKHFDISGNVFAALLFGTYQSQWKESLNASAPISISSFNPSGSYSSFLYNQRHKPSIWGALNGGGDLALSAHVETRNNSKFQIDLGISGEAYASSPLVDKFSSSFSKQTTSFDNFFTFTNAYLKLSYFC